MIKCNKIILTSIICICILCLVSGCIQKGYKNEAGSSNRDSHTGTGSAIGDEKTQEEDKLTSHKIVDLIHYPDQIIYYHEGEKEAINKGDEKFDRIFELTKKRFTGELDIALSAIEESYITDLKSNLHSLEFVYVNDVFIKWQKDMNFYYEFTYDSLLFPLEGEFKEMLIILPVQNGPIAYLKKADELLEYLNQ